jgi:hypothetical protein
MDFGVPFKESEIPVIPQRPVVTFGEKDLFGKLSSKLSAHRLPPGIKLIDGIYQGRLL